MGLSERLSSTRSGASGQRVSPRLAHGLPWPSSRFGSRGARAAAVHRGGPCPLRWASVTTRLARCARAMAVLVRERGGGRERAVRRASVTREWCSLRRGSSLVARMARACSLSLFAPLCRLSPLTSQRVVHIGGWWGARDGAPYTTTSCAPHRAGDPDAQRRRPTRPREDRPEFACLCTTFASAAFLPGLVCPAPWLFPLGFFLFFCACAPGRTLSCSLFASFQPPHTPRAKTKA